MYRSFYSPAADAYNSLPFRSWGDEMYAMSQRSAPLSNYMGAPLPPQSAPPMNHVEPAVAGGFMYPPFGAPLSAPAAFMRPMPGAGILYPSVHPGLSMNPYPTIPFVDPAFGGGGMFMPTLNGAIDGVMRLSINLRYRGKQSLILSESARIAIPTYARVVDVWLALVADRATEGLRRYSKRLTGKVEAVDALRDATGSLRLGDSLEMLQGTAMDTLIFIVEPSTFGQLVEASSNALSQVLDATSGGRRTIQIGRGRYGRNNKYVVPSGYGSGHVAYNGYSRGQGAYSY